jgi:hypothetical protein
MALNFDGTTLPKIAVNVGIGAVPGGSICVVDSGLVGTNVTGGLNMVDLAADAQALQVKRGRASDIDSATPGTCAVTFDNISGAYDHTYSGGPYFGKIEIGVPIEVTMEWPVGQVYRRFVGELADISLDLGYDPTATWTFTDGLEKLGRANLPLEPFPIWDGDLTGRRIGNLSDRARWPFNLRDLDDGNNILGPTLLGGSALELMRQVEMTEFGLLFVDGAGVLKFYDRYRATTANRSVVVQATLADTAAADQVEMVGLEFARSRERVFNRAAITRNPKVTDPDEQPFEQVADDVGSQTTAGPLGEGYGVLAFPAQVGELLNSDTEALAMAQGLVQRFALPADRIREVQVDAVTQGEWDVLLPLGLLDRIAVSRDYGPNTVAAQLLIQGSTEEISDQGPAWSFTFATTPAPPPTTDVCFVDAGVVGTHKVSW